MKEYKVALGIVAAALAGIGIGMLISPNSGKKNREKLLKASDKITKKVRKVAQDSNNSIEEFAQETIERAKAALNQAKGYAKAEANNLKEKLDKAS